MLPKFRKILCATDLSDNASHVMDYAISMAEQFHAELFVLHVLETVSSNPYLQLKGIKSDQAWQSLERDRENELLRALETKLKNLCADLNGRMSECRIHDDNIILKKGVPVEEILKASRELSIDVIVIGTHGYNIVQDALMGGTSRRVVRRSPTPVLVIHNDDP